MVKELEKIVFEKKSLNERQEWLNEAKKQEDMQNSKLYAYIDRYSSKNPEEHDKDLGTPKNTKLYLCITCFCWWP